MSANNVYQALGWLACAGVILLIALVAVIVLLINGQPGDRYARRRGAGPNNSAVHSPPFEEEDFGGVPTTGPVQEYERDYHPDQIIGSSGFDAQSHNRPGPTDDFFTRNNH